MAYDIIVESVPSYRNRIGETIFQGGNNSVLVLGRDRVTTPETGYGSSTAANKGLSAGSAYLAVGLSGQDPSLADDKSYIYVSMLTDIDDNAGTNFQDVVKQAAGTILKSDHVRIVGRSTMKIGVGRAQLTLKADGSVIIEGDIKLGETASQRVLRGEITVGWATSHTHIDSKGGPTGPAIQPFPASGYADRVKC